MANKRFEYIDAARAIGMAFVIWGHTYFGFSDFYLFTFTIPMFFMLSGMVFTPNKYNSFKPFVLRKAKCLLLPYATYSVITWVIWAIYVTLTHQCEGNIWMPLFETIISRGGQGYLVHNAPLWFVPCLFVAEVSFYWISKLPDWFNLIVCFILATISHCLTVYVHSFDLRAMPWSIDIAMLALPFFSVGYLLIKRIGHAKIVATINKKPAIYLGIATLLYACAYIININNGPTSLGRSHLYNPFLFYPDAFMGAAATVIVSILLSDIFAKVKIWRHILWFGANSLVALSIHNPIRGVLISMTASKLSVETTVVRESLPISLCIWTTTIAITVPIMIVIVRFKKSKQK